VLRPRLVPKEARLDSALLLLSVFAGIGFFGFMGIVLGPVVMIIITTTIKVFLDVFKNVQYDDDDDSLPKAGVMKRTKRWFARATG
jgi:predicted PurR-regulated permease PerM